VQQIWISAYAAAPAAVCRWRVGEDIDVLVPSVGGCVMGCWWWKAVPRSWTNLVGCDVDLDWGWWDVIGIRDFRRGYPLTLPIAMLTVPALATFQTVVGQHVYAGNLRFAMAPENARLG